MTQWVVGRSHKPLLRSSLALTNDIVFMNFMTSKHLSVFLAIKKTAWSVNISRIKWNNTHESTLVLTFIQSVLTHSFSIPTYYLLHTMTSLMLLLRSLPSLSFNFNMFCILLIFPFTTFWNNFPLSVALWPSVNEVCNNPVFDLSSLWVSSSVF